MIEIDKRSDVSAYIKVGNITVYVEDSEAAPEFVHVWKNESKDLLQTSDGEIQIINGETK
tara:strand:+ start:44 stop:223 length:180 start_codon:yes stop_codon:yes gene_type:complete